MVLKRSSTRVPLDSEFLPCIGLVAGADGVAAKPLLATPPSTNTMDLPRTLGRQVVG